MRTVESDERSSKATPLLEWQTFDLDAARQTPKQITWTTSAPYSEGTQQSRWLGRKWRIGAALLIILTMIGGWTWSVAQRGLAEIEAELGDRVELDLWTTATQDDGLRPASEQKIHKRSILVQGDATRPLTSTVQLLALKGETAIVQLVTQSGADQPALHQTRFYRQTAEGWLPAKPDDELWGSPRGLESDHFIFQYRENDAQVVNLVALQMDDVYTELQRNFGLTANTEKLVIEVTVERVTGATLIPLWPHGPLVVPSPAIYLAPVELNDSAILAQSIALPLIDYLGERAMEDNAIPPRWRPLLGGLRLWQLWDLEAPLAYWRRDVVRSLFMDVSTDGPVQQPLPEPYPDLCAMHSLWMQSPLMVGIPLECHVLDEGTWVATRGLTNGLHTHFDQLRIPLRVSDQYHDEEGYLFSPTEVVAIATLLDYAVATYGYEKLPVLLAGMAQYDDWETLAPAVFGVSAPDLEAGWRSYLVQQYNVSMGR